MIRLQIAIQLDYEVSATGSDFVFNIHAAQTARQHVLDEQLTLSQPVAYRVENEPSSGNRLLRFSAPPGQLQVNYRATLDVHHFIGSPELIPEVPVAKLPPEALVYIYPSRYCPSDRLHQLAMREFGSRWQGYSRVQSICDWVRERTTFASNTSTSQTSALDTLLDQTGVCRDFAHLMIALCRAINIPARFATGIDYGADPALGPTDFHAYVEVYLGDRWYMFDPSGTAIPMGFMRFGIGRDAADTAFATIFGSVKTHAPVIDIQAIAGADGRLRQPFHCGRALSTDG
ncbi:transglutaminase family protein [Ideonella azotifigens]|uniref:Transglutaminase family protein n=1 Tax=Ideonella azotifigens TaxID=513160 RepID=A0ABN1K2S4_9BURK|nr:transglutaminase family protein [Ideonella azotifigens]MCD2344581.1 transglutaminase family protein [Ideonella azotifigens]